MFSQTHHIFHSAMNAFGERCRKNDQDLSTSPLTIISRHNPVVTEFGPIFLGRYVALGVQGPIDSYRLKPHQKENKRNSELNLKLTFQQRKNSQGTEELSELQADLIRAQSRTVNE